ncbi:hypothetical protein HMPREF0454_02832 [Hafnia alvei ATCC 51873]|uniref:Uncharacterized protein n=1 Tax=Hafnia alvei ATCC 51873 TaxID=1002364 RepID=G9Y8E8_HAFAL|nr:hypothetical protein HMPREF0454_02832 [Hafnia alvei ATCC 51873]
MHASHIHDAAPDKYLLTVSMLRLSIGQRSIQGMNSLSAGMKCIKAGMNERKTG